jgi:hypothetical protein
MKLRLWIWIAAPLLIGLVIPTISSPAARARQEPPPLILFGYEGAWRWDGPGAAPEKLVDSPQGAVVPSPDAMRLALLQWTEAGMDWGLDEFNIADNVWVIDLATGEMTQLSQQPPDASAQKWVMHSLPAWSPDGTRLSWAEVAIPGRTQQLVVYDFASGSTATLLDGPPAQGDSPLAQVYWSQSGIAIRSSNFNTSGGGLLSESVMILDEDGGLLTTAAVDVSTRFTFGAAWMAYDEAEQFAVLYNDGSWAMIDPLTGNIEVQEIVLELYNPLRPDDSASVYFMLDACDDSGMVITCDYVAQAEHGAQSRELAHLDYLFDIFGQTMAVSPDGQTVATIQPDGIYFWPDGVFTSFEAVSLPPIRGIAWGPAAWRARARP